MILLFFLSCSKSDKISSQRERYVITSPEIAELIYLINAQNNVVGVTIECDYPSVYKSLPKVGNFGKVDVEKILNLKPDIVFTTKLEQDELNHTLSKLNIRTISLYPKTVDEVLNSIVKLGEITGNKKRATFVVDSLKSELETIKTQNKKIIKKKRVYIEIYNNPLMSVSDESFVGNLIKYAGGENIFKTLPRDYSMVKQEDIIKKNPQVIISLLPGETKERIASRKGWQNIDAVKNGRIYTVKDIDPDVVLRAGSRIIIGIKSLQKLIYDEK